MNRRILSLSALFLVLVILPSCEDKVIEPEDASLTIIFEHYVENESVVFNDIRFTSAFGNVYSVATLRYFVSDIKLVKNDGGTVFIDREHYVDGMDPATMTFEPGIGIPPGDYRSLSFIFGLNEEKNVSGRFLNPPESNMEWPLALGPGYHYMKLEGKFEADGTPKNYQAHTGATDGNQNYINVVLPNSSFTTSGNEITITIRMDINRWWDSPNTFDLNDMTMIMGNQEMQRKLHDNGMNVFTMVSAE